MKYYQDDVVELFLDVIAKLKDDYPLKRPIAFEKRLTYESMISKFQLKRNKKRKCVWCRKGSHGEICLLKK